MFGEHLCRLNNIPGKTLNRVVETGILINLRRKCMILIMINENHPKTQVYFKFTRAKRIEERRHLLKYVGIIHPYSIFSLYWEFVMIIMYTITFMITSLSAILRLGYLLTMLIYIKIFLDVIMTMDILKTFCTGYYDTELNKTILKRSSIAKKYLKSYFLVDLLNPGHLAMALYVLTTQRPFGRNWGSLLRCIFYLRILRIGRWLDALQLLHSYANLSSYWNSVLRTAFIFVVCLTWLYSVIFQIEKTLDAWFQVSSKYVGGSPYWPFFSATLMLLHVSCGDESVPHHVHQILALVFFMSVGYCLQLFLFTQILQVSLLDL
ncbi:hypothetical protein JTB14_033928 [Gonioctena quinquepunctata]|nr:hypothetical protein JTB14_033928 [Gonioctena quinquepunctata]